MTNKRNKTAASIVCAGSILLAGVMLGGCSKNDMTQTEKQVQTEAAPQTEAKAQTEAALQTEAKAQTEAAAQIETKEQINESEQSAVEADRVDVVLSGGSGRASVQSPAAVIEKDGQQMVQIVWSSNHYDYMIVDGVKYLNEATEGNSTFTIPAADLSQPLPVTADTTAMSTPHEIEYELLFSPHMSDAIEDGSADDVQHSDSEAENLQPENAETESANAANEEAEMIGSDKTSADTEGTDSAAADTERTDVNAAGTSDWNSMTITGSMQLVYAQEFSVDYYGNLLLLGIGEDQKYLIVPDGESVPVNVPEDIHILEGYPEKAYLVSSSAMDLVRAAQSMDHLSFCGTKESDWYIEEAAAAMADGTLLYAGKYSAPDYELLLAGGCDLAIENTMISHNPQVQEKLETLGIPVMVERSSYEVHPLGRLEWVRFYGAIFGNAEEADRYYFEQIEKINPVLKSEKKGKTAAFFSINSSGAATVRKPGDYISKAIELAGGRYIFTDTAQEADNALSTMNMQMEDFYAGAKEADILIYNGTIEGELKSLSDLLEKSSLFSDFAAVKSGFVFSASKNLFQQTTGTADFILDLNKVMNALADGTPVSQLELTYLTVLE